MSIFCSAKIVYKIIKEKADFIIEKKRRKSYNKRRFANVESFWGFATKIKHMSSIL